MAEQESFYKIESSEGLGSLVRKARLSLGLTQADAAGLLGVGIRFLSELERGKPTLEIERVLRVAIGLGLSVRVGMTSLERRNRTDG